MVTSSRIAFISLSLLSASQIVLGRERWLERDGKPVYLHPRRFPSGRVLAVEAASADPCPATVTVTVNAAATSDAVDIASTAAAATSTGSSSSIGNFGSCGIPEISFGVGFDNRKETAFEPTDQKSYNHGSADNIGVITSFICLALTNTCGADATAKATCQTALNAAAAATAPTGAQADAFNAVFGIITDFNALGVVSNTGAVLVPPSGSSDVASSVAVGSSQSTSVVASVATSVDTSVATSSAIVDTTAATTAAVATSTASSSSIGNFGSCTVPQIKFGTGFDGRTETAFEPVDETSYPHTSADNIDIITEFICNTLTNSCGADATAKATCAKAQTAADAQTAKTGNQADAFNAVFGIQTSFSDVPAVDDQGNFVPGTGSAAAIAALGIGNFGKCTVPQIKFGTGFDGRTETAFEPVDETSYPHTSADNIDIITQFICNTLTNSCGADAAAKATCAKAQAAADAQTAKTGAQADAFNAAFNITTDFAAVTEIDDQGNPVTA